MLAALDSATDSIDRKAIAGMLMKLFDHWKLSTEEQLDALGFSVTNRAALARYRRGEPISGSRDTLERAGHLLGIHKNLRLLFPADRDLAYAWIKTRNRAFDNRTPIEVIREFGFAGLLMVLAYLDRARGQ
ncbi:MAG: MbcA/ParS/Xre antitoxin family protein [Zoogloea sp.]|nr:MbcA/ParS/Xre antitoxin family protein [Zoogloea sp.]